MFSQLSKALKRKLTKSCQCQGSQYILILFCDLLSILLKVDVLRFRGPSFGIKTVRENFHTGYRVCKVKTLGCTICLNKVQVHTLHTFILDFRVQLTDLFK